MNWRTSPLVFIDCETTGVDATTDRIIELAIRIVQPDQPTLSQSWLINPCVPIPPESTAVHGISDADVSAAPKFKSIAGAIHMLASTGIPVAYNARFDRAMLIAEYLRAGVEMPAFLRSGAPWIDPLTWVRAHEPYAKGAGRHKLANVAARWKLEAGTAHRALGDCETTERVLGHLAAVPGLMPDSIEDLIARQRLLAAEQELEFQRFITTRKVA
jgi:DNA polymerase-3 subunit epsilon